MKNPLAKILRVAAVTIAMLLPIAAVAPTTANAAPPPATQQKTYVNEIAELFELHNAERAKAGIAPLVFAVTPSLTISQKWNDVQADRDNETLNHQSIAAMRWAGTSPVGENLIIGVNPKVAGAGIYAGTPDKLIARWMNSAGHRANIMNANYKYIGIGWSVAKSGDVYATTNFYGGTPTTAGKLFTTGAQIIGQHSVTNNNVNVYTTPGTHTVNGRLWRTTCSAYTGEPRPITRCRAEIWGTIITYANGKYTQSNGWNFNNLTYLPVPKSWWNGNPLAKNGEFTSSGRQWKTSCADSWTGPNGCRSFIKTNVVTSYLDAKGQRQFKVVPNQWVFNNIVMFKS